MYRTSGSASGAFLVLLLLLSACAPSREVARAPSPEVARAPEPIPELPPVPEVRGPVEVTLAYPPPGAVKPDVDSTFVFGSTANGQAQLTINGIRVPVAPNGAFLAYLPVPDDGTYHFVARAGSQTDTHVYVHRVPEPPAPAVEIFETPLLGVVTGGRDTLATGSQITAAAPSPGGDRRWFFPRGARLTITGKLDDQLRVQLAEGVEGWLAAGEVELGEPAPPTPPATGAIETVSSPGHLDFRIDAPFTPFRVSDEGNRVTIILYGQSAPAAAVPAQDNLLREARWEESVADTAVLALTLAAPMWGYKAFYDTTGTLVVRVRRPPAIDNQRPFAGLLVMIDPGHPPGGAIGPTGLTEADANLEISLRLADLLRAEGADVLLTRTTEEALVSATSVATELWARVDLAVERDADILVSVHNNAFAEGTNPFLNYGSETYYFHPFSEDLASALVDEIVAVTGLPHLGAKQRSLALVRPSWMPSTLTESLFMMFPQQEAALKNPLFLDQLAAAHFRGIDTFLRERARQDTRVGR